MNGWLLAEAKPWAGATLHGGLTFFTRSIFGERLTPKVAAVWQPRPDDTVKAIGSMGFRPPTLVEALFEDGLFYLNPLTCAGGSGDVRRALLAFLAVTLAAGSLLASTARAQELPPQRSAMLLLRLLADDRNLQ